MNNENANQKQDIPSIIDTLNNDHLPSGVPIRRAGICSNIYKTKKSAQAILIQHGTDYFLYLLPWYNICHWCLYETRKDSITTDTKPNTTRQCNLSLYDLQ